MLERWGQRMKREHSGAVGEALAYSLSTSGKCLRPALLTAAYRELGGSGDPAELAAAVEVVHTYSLVHDDLPCMDDDDLRRGRPTTHRQFDVATAAEAAFLMVPLAGRILVLGASELRLSRRTTCAVALELYRAAGAAGMICGQVLDLEAEGREVSRDELVRIHEAKTGALITASGVMGALAAEATTEQVEAVRMYGREAGLAFQIVDDILDATGTSSDLGKTAGKDAQQRKATFATLVGVEQAIHEAAGHVQRAVDHLASVGLDSGLLGALAHYITERSN